MRRRAVAGKLASAMDWLLGRRVAPNVETAVVDWLPGVGKDTTGLASLRSNVCCLNVRAQLIA